MQKLWHYVFIKWQCLVWHDFQGEATMEKLFLSISREGNSIVDDALSGEDASETRHYRKYSFISRTLSSCSTCDKRRFQQFHSQFPFIEASSLPLLGDKRSGAPKLRQRALK